MLKIGLRRRALRGNHASRVARIPDPNKAESEDGERLFERIARGIRLAPIPAGSPALAPSRKRRGAVIGKVCTKPIVTASPDMTVATRLADVMRESLTVIGEEDEGILDAAKLFDKTGVRRLPVVNKAGKVVGIIALDDLIMLLGDEMGRLASGMARGLKRTAA
jgi:CBS domain-containing protein